MNSLPSLVTAVALAACHHAPKGPRLPHGPLASSLARWLPADAAVIVAIGPDGSAGIDDVTTALGWIGPGVLASIDPAITAAWAGAAVKPRGAVWMMWDDDARSTATCAVVGDAEKIAAALATGGGAREVSSSAEVVRLGDAIVVLRDGVACVVESGAPTRTEHHALRLAALTDEDRLLIAQPDAAALLGALPEAQVIAYGRGELIAALIEVSPGAAAEALAGEGLALALDVEPESHHARITIASAVLGQQPPRPDHGDVSPGALALHAPPVRRPDLPLPAKDENPDVPFTPEYKQAEGELAQSLAAAVELGQRLDAVEQGARAAFDAAWGSAAWIRRAEGPIELVETAWDPPAWPAAQLRVAGDAAELAARDTEPALRAQYDTAIADVAAKIAERTRVRAHDVAAWDRTHRP